ncbi:putative cytochrome p450 [Trypoxylus dichotomus]
MKDHTVLKESKYKDVKKNIIKYAVGSRLTIFFLQLLSNIFIPDHNANVFIYPKQNVSNTNADNVMFMMFDGFTKWDAQYFIHVALYGYTHENTIAFFPLYPLTISTRTNTNIKKFDEIPGPISIPIIGTLHNYLPIIGPYQFDRLHHNGFKKLSRYGSIVREEMVPKVNIVWLFKPEDIETLFRTEGKYPQRRSHLALEKYRLDKPNIYNTGGLLPTNGPEWLRLRSVLQKGLSSPISVQNFLPSTNNIVQDWLLRIKELSQQPNVDYLPELSRLFLELTCMVAFDLRLDCFSKRELKPSSRTSKLIEAALVTNSCILKTDNGPQLWRKFDTPLYRKLRNAQQYMEDVAIDLLSLKMSLFKEKQTATSMSLLENYLSSPELDFKDIIGVACDFLLAGIDTTTYSTSFILHHIAENELAQEALYKECRKLLPSPFSPITKDVLAQAQYAKAVLKESLRLRPISIGIGRILDQDTVFSNYHVPKGTVVVTQNQVACLQERYFVHARQFIPERWLKTQKVYKQPHPYLVLPFGHGGRSCIARRLAEQNMLVCLMKVCRTFKIGWNGKSIDSRSLLINKPDGPISLTFEVRRTIQ